MRTADLLQLASLGLRENRLRTALTALGVVVGVFALTTIIALGGGLEASIKEQLTDDESRTRLIVRPGFGPRQEEAPEVEGVDDPVKADRLRKAIKKRKRGGPGQMRRTLLTRSAIAEISSRAHVIAVRPLAIDRFALALGEHTVDGGLSYGVTGDDPHWTKRIIAGEPIRAGVRAVWLHEYLLYSWGYRTDAEQRALVGQTITLSRPRESSGLSAWLSAARANGIDLPVDDGQAEAMAKMFAQRLGLGAGATGPDPDLSIALPIGGVLRERIEEDGFEVWEDSFSMQADLFLPQDLAEALFEQVPSNVTRGYNAAAVEVDAPERTREVERALREEGYGTVSIDTLLERVETTVAIITAMVSGLTAIALVVAMLGIVNTMVMNVSERTREIGVLKALGATDRQIRGLFLFESAIIGLVGGVVGVGLALLVQFPGDYYAQQAILEVSQYRYDGSIFRYPGWLLGLAMLFAVGLSVLAALGPSSRAARVDPVIALRDE